MSEAKLGVLIVLPFENLRSFRRKNNKITLGEDVEVGLAKLISLLKNTIYIKQGLYCLRKKLKTITSLITAWICRFALLVKLWEEQEQWTTYD